ncbi:MAG: hypothetical protein Fur0037_07560 [Planctomycetota bacterium]
MLSLLVLLVFALGSPAGEPSGRTEGRIEGESPATGAPRAASADPGAGSDSARPEDHSRDLLLPDGTYVPALSGAVDAAPLARYWGPLPWSPIVEFVRSGGIDWYRHEDGSFSTTQMVWRSDLGREAAMTRVAHPGPEPPPVQSR